jgi:hypothetical protein
MARSSENAEKNFCRGVYRSRGQPVPACAQGPLRRRPLSRGGYGDCGCSPRERARGVTLRHSCGRRCAQRPGAW